MSILIKGMEMPKNCHNCELLTRIKVTYGTVYACQILNEVIRNVMVRQINCPLVEVDVNEIDEAIKALKGVRDAYRIITEAFCRPPEIDINGKTSIPDQVVQ